VRIHDDRRIGEIEMLAVDPAHQSVGVGTTLTTYALDWIKASGIAVAMSAPEQIPDTRRRGAPTRRPG
jgi:ribosomal protein S18 acetylase RimI-like enzyme